MHASSIRRPRFEPAVFAAPPLGRYPTPVRRLSALDGPGAELWMKDDGVIHPRYGGNKVRKLELILEQAERRGARRLVTAGAAGSHHALAMALFGSERGFAVSAVLCPQPWTPHAEDTLRAALAAGLDVRVARSAADVPRVLAQTLRRGDFFVPPGGASRTGTLGYVRAVAELVTQIDRGELPEPDVIVVAAGSGSTVAGLAAGVVREGLRTRVVGATVAAPAKPLAAWVLWLAERALYHEAKNRAILRLQTAVELDPRFRGAGYGVRSDAGRAAAEKARTLGLSLDPTYTEKAFAAALRLVGSAAFETIPGATERVAADRPLRVLYWHTLSAAPLAAPCQRAPARLDERLLPRS